MPPAVSRHVGLRDLGPAARLGRCGRAVRRRGPTIRQWVDAKVFRGQSGHELNTQIDARDRASRPLRRSSGHAHTCPRSGRFLREVRRNRSETPYNYDEGAYYAAAIRMSGGERPYQDFLYVQPPGLATLTAFGLLARMTLSSQRAVHAVSGLALAAVVFLLARCATRRPHAPAMATLFLVSSPLFFAYTRMVMTDLTAATLTAGAALALMSCMRGGILLCGTLVAAGSLFRLQGVFLVPFLLPLAAVTRGLRDTFRLAALCAALTAVAQGLIWLAWPHYLADAVLLHQLRPSLSIFERYRTVEAVIADITFATGLLGASALLMSGCPRKAAFGALTLCGFLETTILFNSLFAKYFLMILPFSSVCAALLVSDATASYGRWALSLAAAFVFAVQAPHVVGNIAGPVREARRQRCHRRSTPTPWPDPADCRSWIRTIVR